MKVRNMTSKSGNPVANQFIITDREDDYDIVVFQSYDSVIVRQHNRVDGSTGTLLDEHYWDYSVTTSRYRNQFLGETKAETQKKIDSGEYILTNLNGE